MIQVLAYLLVTIRCLPCKLPPLIDMEEAAVGTPAVAAVGTLVAAAGTPVAEALDTVVEGVAVESSITRDKS